MRLRNTDITRKLTTAAIAPALALALTAGTATAQDYEWEPDEGLHQEEWYDPSDWFNSDDSVDYEYDWADWPYYYDTYSTAYWDGYYDGYYDDEFGYDYWNDAWPYGYTSAYTDGYYDGYYDQLYDYDYDPYYYTYSVAVVPEADKDNNRKQAQKQRDAEKRARDTSRQRGDRAGKAKRDSEMDKQKAAEESTKTRVRGMVSTISQTDRDTGDNLVLRIGFDNRDAVVANFGPKMKRNKLPIESGDRATLIGEHKTANGQKTLVVSKVTVDGETFTLRGPDKEAMKKDMEKKKTKAGY